jgi:hypothetical protein
MEFDERLQRAFEALADSLHQEIAAQLAAVRADLSGSVRADREAAAADAAREARTAADKELSKQVEEAVARVGTDARAEVATHQKAAGERLVEAIRAIDGAHGLSEILDVLIAAAGAEVNRAAIFLEHGATLKSWRLLGFDGLGATDSDVEMPFADGGMIAEASETARLIPLNPGSPRATLLPAFVDLSEQSRALAVPLVMAGQVFAVLYVDEGNNEPAVSDTWPAAIEVLARHAARALEAITASKLAQVVEVASFASR